MTKILTYGTLKEGQRNEPLLGNQKFLGKAVTVNPEFKLYEVNQYMYPFPALVRDTDGYQIYGELYEVNDACLEMLDQLEGVDSGLYERSITSVQLISGEQIDDVLIYTYLRPINDCIHVGQVWPISELSRYRFEGIRLVEDKEEDVYEEGVALWNKRNDTWATKIFESEIELSQYCNQKRQAFGSSKSSPIAWNVQWFEPRKQLYKKTAKKCQCVLLGNASPLFDSRYQLADWMSENLTFFGGTKGTAKQWLKIMTDVILKIDE